MNPVFNELSRGPLLFDGAMGTYFAALPGRAEYRCERANLEAPEEILTIHRAYLEAGCRAIKTNTFSLGADLAAGEEGEAFALLDAACRIANEAAAPFGAHVFGDMGPISGFDGDCGMLFCRLADRFLANGVQNFLVETLASADGISQLAAHLRSVCPDAFLLVSFAAGPDGVTRAGLPAAALLKDTSAIPGVHAVGLNCMSGPRHMLETLKKLPLDKIPPRLSVMPNAGYPTVLGRRAVFSGTPDYFAGQLAELAGSGAAILGGCCGTTPTHIARAAEALAHLPQPVVPAQPAAEAAPRVAEANPLWEKLESGKRVIAVELDPPADDAIEPFLHGVATLRDAGADAITIADCPIGRPRADSSLLACKVHRELGIQPLPHMTCRDRNLNATKALLLGLSIEGVHNVLLVTGDPIPTENRDEVKTVFNFNSRKLAAYVSSLNKSTLRTPFRMFGALNLNAKNFDIQLKVAQEKEANGISGFLTQPVLSPEALENLKRAREVLRGKILGGIYPIVSHRNACFLNNEIAGMRVAEDIIAQYEGKNREEAEEISVALCARIAREMAPYTDGLYLMTPFQRVALMTRIIEEIQKQ